MLDHDKRDNRRQKMLDAIESHSDAKTPFVDINLSAVFHDYDLEGDLEPFWCFLREAIEGLENGAMIRLPNNMDVHTFGRVLRGTFESADIYGTIRIRTYTTYLRLYNRNKRFDVKRVQHEDGRKCITPAPVWEIISTPNVAEKEDAQS